jgi:hypothetical protein
VQELTGQPVQVRVGRRAWRVTSVDRLAYDDPELQRLLTQLCAVDKSNDNSGRLA